MWLKENRNIKKKLSLDEFWIYEHNGKYRKQALFLNRTYSLKARYTAPSAMFAIWLSLRVHGLAVVK